MSFIEQEFKNRFKNQQSLDGVDSEQLWAELNANIETTTQPQTSSRKRISLLILLLLLFTCSICYFFYPNSDMVDQKQADQEVPNKVANEPGLIEQNTPELSIMKSNQKIENEPVVLYLNSDTNNSSTNYNHTSKTKQPSFHTENKSTSTLDIFDNTKSIIEDPAPINKLSQHILSQKSNQNNAIDHQVSSIKNSVIPVPTLAIFLPNELSIELDFIATSNKPNIDKKLNQQFELSLLTGINTTFSFFSNDMSGTDLENQLDQAYSNKPGHSTSLKVSWIINDKFRIGSGLEYSNLWTKFSAVQEKEEMGLVKDYLVYFEYNPQTGDTINEVYDDVMLNGINKRSVIHHNNFKYFSIPLEIGWQGQNGQLTYGLNAGLSANFFFKQKGKSLDDSLDIIEFDNSLSDDIPFKQFFLAYHLNPFIDFGVSEKFKLRLSPLVSYQTFGMSNLYQLKQSSIYTSINTGVVVLLN